MFSLKRHRRRSVVAGLTIALGSSMALMPAPAAHAATVFKVEGTSDVSDSNLMSGLIEPGFEAKYPQYDLQYVAKGTGAALTDAQNGLAAAVIVHAAAVENSFVANGYSLESTGRALMYGDYVLAGPASDPAGVGANAPHDIVHALELVAAAGAAGKANFVARTGTPGTAVQERQLWALTSGVPLCTVRSGGSPNYGGGKRPTVDATTPTCSNPDNTTPSGSPPDGAPYPSWYQPGNTMSQAINVSLANTCSFPNGNCYVFTDRGTLAYQQSIGNDQNLKVLTRDNSTTARGGLEGLINVFHAYGVNPAKFTSANATDPVAAKLFLDYLTSPSTQAAIGAFLGTQKPFIPAAAPGLSAQIKGGQLKTGRSATITGQLTNPIPGYPSLSGVAVNLLQTKTNNPLELPKIVATGVTDANGSYLIKHRLKGGKFYQVGVAGVTKLELPTLNPQFSDAFQPTSSAVGTAGSVKARSASTGAGRYLVKGTVKPAGAGKTGRVILYVSRHGHMKKLDTAKLKAGKTKFHLRGKLKPGSYRMQVLVENTVAGAVIPTLSKKFTVRVS